MLKMTKVTLKKIFFPVIPIGAVRYSCPIRLGPDLYTTCKRKKTFGKVSAR